MGKRYTIRLVLMENEKRILQVFRFISVPAIEIKGDGSDDKQVTIKKALHIAV